MKYGFIGAGNMGSALIRAAAKAVSPRDILINDHNDKKALVLADEMGVVATTIEEVAKKSDYIFLGVKPQVMEDMFASINPILKERAKSGEAFVLVSMAAAITIDRIKKMSGDYPVIRIMPNLPARVEEGMMLYSYNDESATYIDDFEKLMKHSGRLLEIREEKMDAGCAVSGCGPAFAYMFIEAMARGGEKCGLSKEDALELATQTVLGAAKNMRESGDAPGDLVKAVCSPGGTTIEGVKSLQAGDFYEEVEKAVEAAYKRAKEM